MSTKIYDAVKVNTANMDKLIDLAKKISEMEQKNFIEELLEKHYKFFCGYKKLKNFDFDNRDFILYCEILYDFVSGSSTYCLDSNLKKILDNFIEEKNLDLTNNMKEKLEELAEEFSACKNLSFFYLDEGHSLMKWYNISKKTEKWIYENFEDYHYQNSTDGYTLEEANKEFSEIINQYIENMKEDYEFSDEAEKAINKVLDNVAMAFIQKRGKDWNVALKGSWRFAEASLSYDMNAVNVLSAKRRMYGFIKTALKKESIDPIMF